MGLVRGCFLLVFNFLLLFKANQEEVFVFKAPKIRRVYFYRDINQSSAYFAIQHDLLLS